MHCCFCTQSSGNKRDFQELFGGSLHREIEVCAISWDVFSSAVNLEEDFTQQSVICKDCRQLLTKYTKRREELENAEAAIHCYQSHCDLLATPPVSLVLLSIGERRPPFHAAVSKPKVSVTKDLLGLSSNCSMTTGSRL